ncbi:MAG: ADP-ribosylglycohydrolase family protein [Endozoicomonas sp.]
MSQDQESNSTHDRILACLYGQAIGDAFGMPSELWPKSRVQQHFGWIDSFLPGPAENIAANEFSRGQFTDDTSQCVALMDSVIASQGQIVPTVLGEHLMAWAERIHAFDKNILGPTSKSALLALQNGTPLEQIEANGITNGSAMRVAPVGCLVATCDKDQFIEAVRLSCLPTHKSDIAIAGAVVIAWSVSRAVEGANWQQIKEEIAPLANDVQRLHESTFSPLLGKRIQYALSVVSEQEDTRAGLNDIYEMVGAGMDIIESIPAAVALVELSGTNPSLCAELAANLGGDTDTIGAMATAICGALQGLSAFDPDYISLINQANNIDFAPYAEALTSFRLSENKTHR